MDTNEEWIVSIIKDTEFACLPFLHAINKNAVSPEIFPLIKKLYIGQEHLATDAFKGKERVSFFLCPEMLSKVLCPTRKNFWENVFFSIKENISELKLTGFNTLKRLGYNQVDSPEGLSIAVRFVSENLPFTLEPHLDMPEKAGVLILYIDNTGLNSRGGTQLFIKNSYGNYEVAIEYDFLENFSILIPRLDNSWHGGSWQGSGTRKTLHIYFFNYKNASDVKNNNSFIL